MQSSYAIYSDRSVFPGYLRAIISKYVFIFLFLFIVLIINVTVFIIRIPFFFFFAALHILVKFKNHAFYEKSNGQATKETYLKMNFIKSGLNLIENLLKRGLVR